MTQREHPDGWDVPPGEARQAWHTEARVRDEAYLARARVAEVLRDQFPRATMADHWFGARQVLAAVGAPEAPAGVGGSGVEAGTRDARRDPWAPVPAPIGRRLALGVIAMAQAGGMPDSYWHWHTDRYVTLACEVLGWTPEQARGADLEELTADAS